MSVDPPGPASPDATDPAPADGGPVSSPKAARVKAGRAAAGPKRTPRPKDKVPAGSTPTPTAATSPGATTTTSPEPGGVRRTITGTSITSPTAAGAAATSVVDRTEVDPLDGAPTPITEVPPTAEAPSRPVRPKRNRSGRRGRRVKRVVRRIDLWSVLKLSLVVYTCLYVAVMATLAALWSLLYTTDTIDKVTSFLADVGLENFHFYGDQMFRACAAIGAVGVMAGTVITVLATALVNVISEVTGGIRLVVIEEEPPS